ncbi:cyclin-dependent kinase 12-like isoform X2 [Physella acuta]|nr:cyclin-dependent kinase 12-like isoform X2 [Physella acuta]XP_059162108.1 cyclin-dependent kinase 12-like isoform X2 [Physella acuta]
MAHLVENVVKQGYLKKGSTGSSRISGFFRRNDSNKWFVFTIRQGIPFLEYYDSELDVFSQQPINSFNLSGCHNVKSMGNTNPPSFCIVCPDRVIELVASSRTQMVEWVNEVEASLIRLGVLKQEVVDHVYSICPAVIQKSKPNKDFQDDLEPETMTSATAVKISEGTSTNGGPGGFGFLSPADIRSDRPSLTPKNSPLAQRSSSGQSSVSSVQPPSSPSTHKPSVQRILTESPPPLPTRPILTPGRAIKQKAEEQQERSESHSSPLQHPDTGSSNDSDFVSPEIIAQLREARKAKNFEKSQHKIPEESHDSRQHTSSPAHLKENPGFSNNAYFDSSQISHQSPIRLLKSMSTPVKSPKRTVARLSGSPTNSGHSSPVSSFQDLDNVFSDSNSVENCYSELPGSIFTDSGIGLERNEMLVGSPSSKPTPMPRRGLPKKSDSPPGSLSNGSDHLSPFDNEIFVNVPESFKHNGDFVLDDIDDEYPLLIQTAVCKDNNTETKSHDKTSKAFPLTYPDKPAGPKSSKDENENFWGPMCDDIEPPDTMAPPIPAIPPLPPRNDSLPTRKQSSKAKNFSSDFKTYPKGKTSTSSKHAKYLDDLSVAPPLPLPRKKGSESFRKSHPPSASHCPPMPPRRSSALHHSNSIPSDCQPPALPSRNSQSFYIKRPQLTGHSNSLDMSPAEDSIHKKEETSDETKLQDIVTSSNLSGLSQKMLIDRSHSLHTVVSLKQTQVEILQTEINQPSVTVQLTHKSCFGLALVEWNNFPCIAGWNQKDFPSLHGKLHVGDLVFSVNNVRVTSVEMAQKLLRQPNASASKTEIMLHRMPYAKVFAIHRSVEGQSLGLKRNGGTGEIIYVDPNGLAAQHGLTQYAPSAYGVKRCNWFITEINNRPLSLFFKDCEIDLRLSAVGREISIVVQPSDFIYEIRHQFKKLKNYKNYITH